MALEELEILCVFFIETCLVHPLIPSTKKKSDTNLRLYVMPFLSQKKKKNNETFSYYCSNEKGKNPISNLIINLGIFVAVDLHSATYIITESIQ